MKDQGGHPLVMKVVISFSTRTQFFDWFLREGEGGSRVMKSPINRHNNGRGVVPVSENRPPQVQTVHTPSRETTVQLKEKEKKKLLSTQLPAAAAIFKMPSIS